MSTTECDLPDPIDARDLVLEVGKKRISDLLPRGSVTLIHGVPKVGKTHAAVQIALAAANGTKLGALAENLSPLRVLYVQLDENRETFARRLCYYTEPLGRGLLSISFDTHEIARAVRVGHIATAYDLVIVDSEVALTRLWHTRAIRLIRTVCDAGMSALVVANDDKLDAPDVSSGLEAAISVWWRVERCDINPDARLVTIRTARDPASSPIASCAFELVLPWSR